MSPSPEFTEAATETIQGAKVAQIIALVKENQLVTALCLFVLWQTGALISAFGYVQGGMC
jgi:hypothetical protein